MAGEVERLFDPTAGRGGERGVEPERAVGEVGHAHTEGRAPAKRLLRRCSPLADGLVRYGHE